MPYTEAHKQQTRKRIILSARRLFNRNGFADVSIEEIMGAAGLTRGGFYKHFAGKEDLYEEAVLEFICADRPEPWQARYVDPAARGAALSRMIVDAYLSRDHFDDRDGSCPMIALPSDVSRGGEAVKGAFRQVLAMMVDTFAANLGPGEGAPRERALALAAMVVGGMVLSRAVDDKVLADELRDSARTQAVAMAGWEAAE
jgi:TetR/AcrR family transcriptional regulator, transcriptional repressor for nem operon